MLKKEDNELLCRVGPGTAMGSYMREFWIPALRAERLEADGAPIRVRLLGEDFVAFRSTDGRVGFFDEGCPHRGPSLALARNEDNALTCIFHGWKFDVSGACVEVPSEPPERRAQFAAKVRIRHYPVREAGTIIWVYLGSRAQPPEFPRFNFTDLPQGHVTSALAVIPCNWFQGLEGQLDSAHVGILHSDWVQKSLYHDTGPRFEFEPQSYGYREAAVRRMPDGQHYVRVRDFALPWYSFIPMGSRADDHMLTMSVPVDDTHSAQWDVTYNFSRPVARYRRAAPQNLDNMADGMALDDYYGQSRPRMREGSWSGFSFLRFEDFAVAIAQGPIVDRSREYLGSSDTSINRARRMLLEAVRRHAKGEPTVGLQQPIRWDTLEAQDAIIAADADWRAVAR
ncbi:MAG TPA: Rieske 2Fe-2S domain-containing protein [Candidatus Binataceae bacterium]|nr:Rieske 2Fe-2S domain-containing protein [Candidatus Binataceae bacterium]